MLESEVIDAIDLDEDFVPIPEFDHALFRWAAAGYVKRLIRARWKSDPGFLTDEQLQRWKLVNISDDSEEDWKLLHWAARDLALLNNNFIPRCGSGGSKLVSEETPVGRLIGNLAFLASFGGGGPDHNGDVIEAAEKLRNGEDVDWLELVDWEKLPEIRDDLDQLPEPSPAVGGSTEELPNLIARISDRLTGQQRKLFNYLCGRPRERTDFSSIHQDIKVHTAFRVDDPDDETIKKALKRLKNQLEDDTEILQNLDMTVGNDYVKMTIREGQI